MNQEKPTKNIFVNHKRRFELSTKLCSFVEERSGMKTQVVAHIDHARGTCEVYFFIGEYRRGETNNAKIIITLETEEYHSVKDWYSIIIDILEKEYSAYMV